LKSEEVWAEFLAPEIGDVFACASATKRAIVKRIVQADSAHQICLNPTLSAVLIIVESGDRGGLKAGGIFHAQKFGHVLACSTTTGAMRKQRPQLDSTHKIGPKATLHTVLIVGDDAV